MLVAASEDQKDKILRSSKKLERKAGQKTPTNIPASRFDTKSESSTKASSTRTQRQKIVGRKELDYHKRQDYATASTPEHSSSHTRGSRDIKLKCMYTNASSLFNKMTELKQRADGYDMIGITETWANEQRNDAEFQIPGFSMFRADRLEAKGRELKPRWCQL